MSRSTATGRTSPDDPGPPGHQTSQTAIASDGTIWVSSPLPGSPATGSPLFGPDGAVHVTTHTWDTAYGPGSTHMPPSSAPTGWYTPR